MHLNFLAGSSLLFLVYKPVSPANNSLIFNQIRSHLRKSILIKFRNCLSNILTENILVLIIKVFYSTKIFTTNDRNHIAPKFCTNTFICVCEFEYLCWCLPLSSFTHRRKTFVFARVLARDPLTAKTRRKIGVLSHYGNIKQTPFRNGQ